MPTWRAIEHHIPIGLASKEVLVAAGEIIMAKARENKVPILPIDSEHAAIKQCLAGINENPAEISKLILTASGGPFFDRALSDFDTITREDALEHPKWNMGPKISIDSATMMNKGLEVIEAHHLFNIPYQHIEVVVHPQSIVHSLVEFTDGTLLGQMGLPDMRFPIQYVLTYPLKYHNNWPKISLTKIAR
jgi:1-deoxy-D-xylulose-5-phosphate reductoisomerase